MVVETFFSSLLILLIIACCIFLSLFEQIYVMIQCSTHILFSSRVFYLVMTYYFSFQVLGVDKSASQRDIQKAFHKYVLLTSYVNEIQLLRSFCFDSYAFFLNYAGCLLNITLIRIKVRVHRKNLRR